MNCGLWQDLVEPAADLHPKFLAEHDVRHEDVVSKVAPRTLCDALFNPGGLCSDRSDEGLPRIRTCCVCSFDELYLKDEGTFRERSSLRKTDRAGSVGVSPVVPMPAPGFHAKTQLGFEKGLDEVFEVVPTKVIESVAEHSTAPYRRSIESAGARNPGPRFTQGASTRQFCMIRLGSNL